MKSLSIDNKKGRNKIPRTDGFAASKVLSFRRSCKYDGLWIQHDMAGTQIANKRGCGGSMTPIP